MFLAFPGLGNSVLQLGYAQILLFGPVQVLQLMHCFIELLVFVRDHIVSTLFCVAAAHVTKVSLKGAPEETTNSGTIACGCLGGG